MRRRARLLMIAKKRLCCAVASRRIFQKDSSRNRRLQIRVGGTTPWRGRDRYRSARRRWRGRARRELHRLERMPEQAAEYRSPGPIWSGCSPCPGPNSTRTVDTEWARKILDEDHYGLAKIKRRILEFLAVRKLNPEGRSPILCFVGPPGIGGTAPSEHRQAHRPQIRPREPGRRAR